MNTRHVVLDTNILVLALLLSCCTGQRLQIPHTDADIVISTIKQYGEEVFIKPSTHQMPDEDDRVFYDIAKYAKACLITGNTKHYPVESFILTPMEFLSKLE